MSAAATTNSFSQQPPDLSPRAARIVLLVILLAAGAIRVGTALQMPVISRDGVLYCWQARDLGRRGAELLATRDYEQHPLYAAAILSAQRIAMACGAEETALTWQRCAQCIAMVSGLVVVLLSFTVTLRLVESVPIAFPRHASALTAAAFAALLPLNVWLSTDVMSEQLFLVPYLGVLLAGGGALGTIRTFSIGLLSGVAFLVRPEGIVPLLGVAIVALRGRMTLRRRAICVAQLLLSFGVIAGPYIVLSGRLSPKLEKETFSADIREIDATPRLAALVRDSVPWFAALPRVALETLRGGRVVLPLTALIGLWCLRHELRAGLPHLLLLVGAGQFMLGALLVWRHGYLDPRHLITVVMLLIPFAAVAPFAAFPARRRSASDAAAAAGGIRLFQLAPYCMILAVVLVFSVYLFRIPNAKEMHLRTAAVWLKSHGSAGPDALLLGGSSERRIAFYAEMRFQPWPENLRDDAERTRAFVDHVAHFQPRAAAFETANDSSQEELRGNAALLPALEHAPGIRQFVINQQSFAATSGKKLHLVEFDFAGAHAVE